MGNLLQWLTILHTWNLHKGTPTFTYFRDTLKVTETPLHSLFKVNKILILAACVTAMITWAMTMIVRVLTAARVTTASLNILTSPWSQTRRAGAQSVARWSRGSRLSMHKRWADKHDVFLSLLFDLNLRLINADKYVHRFMTLLICQLITKIILRNHFYITMTIHRWLMSNMSIRGWMCFLNFGSVWMCVVRVTWRSLCVCVSRSWRTQRWRTRG